MAADHDDLTVGNEYLDVYDGSKSRTYDDGIRHYLCNDRWIVIFLQPLSYSGRFDPVLNTVQGNSEHAVKGTDRSYAIILEDGHILWKNDRFSEIVDGREKFIQKIIPELNKGIFPKDDETRNELEITYKERDYQVELRRISLEGFSESERMLQIPKEKEYFIALYMRDLTELNSYIRENEDQRLIAGLIYIDNYDEVMESWKKSVSLFWSL